MYLTFAADFFFLLRIKNTWNYNKWEWNYTKIPNKTSIYL